MIFDTAKFLKDVVTQNANDLPKHFTPNAVIYWHCSNEQLTVDEYVKANCEYPGNWEGTVERTEKIEGGMVIASRISSGKDTFLITAFAKLEKGKISRLDEYYSECGPVPQWRQEMKIGKPIKV